MEKSSGDSDSQAVNDDEDDRESRIPVMKNMVDQNQSGVEADSEGQGSGSKGSGDNKRVGEKDVPPEAAAGPLTTNAPEVRRIVYLGYLFAVIDLVGVRIIYMNISGLFCWLLGPSSLGGAAVAEWLSSWLAEQEVLGSIPGLTT